MRKIIEKPRPRRPASKKRREVSLMAEFKVWIQTIMTRAAMQRYWDMETESSITLKKFLFTTLADRKSVV